MKAFFVSAIVAAGIFVGCNTSTIPGECLKALEDNNVPASVIELIKDQASGDLSFVQRTAVRLAFEQAGVDDVCGKFAQ